MRFYVTNPFRLLFPHALWSTSSRDLHLTFDDGPHPSATPQILDILERFNARATFFMLGSHVKKYPTLAKEAASRGHELGNHSYDHMNLLFARSDVIRSQISDTGSLIQDACGTRPRFFRPPYGFFDWRTIRIARDLGYRFTLWSADPGDFEPVVADTIIKRTIRHLRPGSIILLHDNEQTARSAPTIVTGLLSEMKHRGISSAPLPHDS